MKQVRGPVGGLGPRLLHRARAGGGGMLLGQRWHFLPKWLRRAGFQWGGRKVANARIERTAELHGYVSTALSTGSVERGRAMQSSRPRRRGSAKRPPGSKDIEHSRTPPPRALWPFDALRTASAVPGGSEA